MGLQIWWWGEEISPCHRPTMGLTQSNLFERPGVGQIQFGDSLLIWDQTWTGLCGKTRWLLDLLSFCHGAFWLGLTMWNYVDTRTRGGVWNSGAFALKRK